MKTLKVDHIGIAVKNLEESVKYYKEILGLEPSGVEVFEDQKVRVAFLKCGESKLEIMESTSSDGPITKYIEKNGEGIQHISLRVDNIETALAKHKAKEIRLINEKPSCFMGGVKTAFVHPKEASGVLIELCERNLSK